jgi:hypothetical protein
MQQFTFISSSICVNRIRSKRASSHALLRTSLESLCTWPFYVSKWLDLAGGTLK